LPNLPGVWLSALFLVGLTGLQLWAQEEANERILFHAKVLTGDLQNPYAEAAGRSRATGSSL